MFLFLQVTEWSSKQIYNKLASYCFENDPLKRSSFTDIVHVIEEVLSDDEKVSYKELTELYENMGQLMSEQAPKLQKSTTEENSCDTKKFYSKTKNNPAIAQDSSLLSIDEISMSDEIEQNRNYVKIQENSTNSSIYHYNLPSESSSIVEDPSFSGYKQVFSPSQDLKSHDT